jgi:hypothetical protein
MVPSLAKWRTQGQAVERWTARWLDLLWIASEAFFFQFKTVVASL